MDERDTSQLSKFSNFILQLFDIKIYLFIVQSPINYYKNSQDIKINIQKDISKSIFVVPIQDLIHNEIF